jgi:hypothetical protein
MRSEHKETKLSAITFAYGFKMTEEEMYQRVWHYSPAKMKGKGVYEPLECLECLKLTNKMLLEEI